jgi:hypothetical protein
MLYPKFIPGRFDVVCTLEYHNTETKVKVTMSFRKEGEFRRQHCGGDSVRLVLQPSASK